MSRDLKGRRWTPELVLIVFGPDVARSLEELLQLLPAHVYGLLAAVVAVALVSGWRKLRANRSRRP